MAKYDPDWVRSFYDQYGEQEWARWDISPVERIKLEVHLHYVRKYLKAGDRVLEMGAGPGRFTQELARITKRIVVADISPVQLGLNRKNALEMHFSESVESWVECDMCDLACFTEGEFDAVVCYGGPLSYVFDEREVAIGELLRVTKPGGFMLFGVMSLWGSVHQYLPQVLELDSQLNRQILASGDLTPDTPEASIHFCHMYRADEFRTFLERSGAVVEVISASDCLSATWAEYLGTLPDDSEAWQLLLEAEIEACREPGCVDMGTHLIAVCRK
jgi:ubiquinone/menaquinone biosynthesis C-methylase UbiE